MSQINLKSQTAAATTTPPTGYKALYFDTTAGQWRYLDETGASFTFNSAVTTVSVTTANGFAGSVANATTTPAITVSTTVTGILSGNGTAVSAASTVGSGAIVLATSPSLSTPALGTPTALVGTNITGTASGLTAGTVTTNANLTGPITSSGNATAVTTNAITNTMLAQIASHSYKGNNTGSTANAADITSTQLTADLNVATTSLQGMMSSTDKSRNDNWFNKAFYNVLDNGISTANSASTNVTAWNALTAAAVDNATIFFPPSSTAYSFDSALTIPSGKHFRVQGGGRGKSIIQTTSGTANIFTPGDWYNEFVGLKFTSSVTRTAGAAILSGNNVGINAYDCEFVGMFNAVDYSGGASAGNIAFVFDCVFTNTVNFSIRFDGTNANAFISNCTADGAPAAVAHVEINACGSLLISDSDFIRATNNLRLNPDSGTKGVFSVYCVNVFFDTAAASSVKFMGGAAGTNVQRVKFVNCWFSGSVTGCEFAANSSTNKATAIDFIGCDIFSNSANGVLVTEVQDFAMSNCRIAGNTTAGVNILATAGSVTKFNIQNCTVGPTAGPGANGIGINIQAGTYGSYNVTGNNVAGNTSNNNIIDLGTVATTDLKNVEDNLGHLLKGAIATLSAPLSVPVTTETLVLAARVPANSVLVGQAFRVRAIAVTAGANVPTWNCKVGTNGTTADTPACTIVSTASLANGRVGVEFHIVIRSLGAPGTLYADGLAHSGAGVNAVVWSEKAVGAAATTNVTTSGVWFITLTMSQTVNSSLVQIASIESL